ncbi:hypothetical protein DMA11_03065 [Marinilabiliaceae bacterium JC017]|nr:hypothetical protein DMA11_03065 [Marinilabiliaceae bacterium JC017]
MRPDYLITTLDIQTPLIGVYDSPDLDLFEPVMTPQKGKHICMFSYYNAWKKNVTLKLTKDNFGCGGCGYWWFGKEGRTREQFVNFLCKEEGLKSTSENMNLWIDKLKPNQPEKEALFIGPFRDEAWKYLKTITFFVNPDQLSALIIGANYFHRPGDPEPVKVPFGSGCMELLTLVGNEFPVGVIGATDLAMRKYLPADLLAFTVNKPMFENFCRLDQNSFLNKPFLSSLVKARKRAL